MTRRYDDPVDVRRRDEDPAEFLWRGRHYAVREVLARCRGSTGARRIHVGAASTTRWCEAGCAVRSERWSRALSTAGATGVERGRIRCAARAVPPAAAGR